MHARSTVLSGFVPLSVPLPHALGCRNMRRACATQAACTRHHGSPASFYIPPPPLGQTATLPHSSPTMATAALHTHPCLPPPCATALSLGLDSLDLQFLACLPHCYCKQCPHYMAMQRHLPPPNSMALLPDLETYCHILFPVFTSLSLRRRRSQVGRVGMVEVWGIRWWWCESGG